MINIKEFDIEIVSMNGGWFQCTSDLNMHPVFEINVKIRDYVTFFWPARLIIDKIF